RSLPKGCMSSSTSGPLAYAIGKSSTTGSGACPEPTPTLPSLPPPHAPTAPVSATRNRRAVGTNAERRAPSRLAARRFNVIMASANNEHVKKGLPLTRSQDHGNTRSRASNGERRLDLRAPRLFRRRRRRCPPRKPLQETGSSSPSRSLLGG